MAFVDRQLELMDVVGLQGETISEVVDLGVTPTLRSGPLQNSYLVVDCVIGEEADGVDPATHVTFSLESDSVEALSSSPTVHWSSGLIPVASLVTGFNIGIVPLPQKANYERYLGLRVLPSGGSPGLLVGNGGFSAYITHDPSIRTLYPDAI